MPQIDIRINGKGGAFADLFNGKSLIKMPDQAPIRMETLDGGMQSGAPSISLILETLNGKAVLVAETSVKLFQMAAYTTMAKYGDLTEGAITGFLSQGGKAELTFSRVEKCPQCHTEQAGSNKYCCECGIKL